MTRERELTGKHVLAMFVAFFGVIIAVNITMAMMARGSWTGLVAKNSYVASLDFNQQLADAAEQRARGWSDRLDYAGGQLVLHLVDAEGRALRLEGGMLAYGRPVAETADSVVALMPLGAVQGANIDLAPGLWQVEVSGEVDGARWLRKARLIVEPDGEVVWQ